jgi:hypothetical protein
VQSSETLELDDAAEHERVERLPVAVPPLRK